MLMTNETPIAVIEGPKGKAEIYEYLTPADEAVEYEVRFNNEKKIFNNLGEAYLTAGELAGTQT